MLIGVRKTGMLSSKYSRVPTAAICWSWCKCSTRKQLSLLGVTIVNSHYWSIVGDNMGWTKDREYTVAADVVCPIWAIAWEEIENTMVNMDTAPVCPFSNDLRCVFGLCLSGTPTSPLCLDFETLGSRGRRRPVKSGEVVKTPNIWPRPLLRGCAEKTHCCHKERTPVTIGRFTWGFSATNSYQWCWNTRPAVPVPVGATNSNQR